MRSTETHSHTLTQERGHAICACLRVSRQVCYPRLRQSESTVPLEPASEPAKHVCDWSHGQTHSGSVKETCKRQTCFLSVAVACAVPSRCRCAGTSWCMCVLRAACACIFHLLRAVAVQQRTLDLAKRQHLKRGLAGSVYIQMRRWWRPAWRAHAWARSCRADSWQ